MGKRGNWKSECRKNHGMSDCKKKKHGKKCPEQAEVRSINFRSVCISRHYQLDFSNVEGIEDCVPQCGSDLCFSCE